MRLTTNWRRPLFTTLASMIFLLLVGCSNSNQQREAGDALFSLSLGKLPTQMYLFSDDKFIPNTRNYIRSTRGTIYISDKVSQKVMGFTSYGDLIYLLQNSNNPPAAGISNFVSVSYPFNNIGLITVAPQSMLHVQEELPSASQIFDPQDGMVLENRILRFDSKGQYRDFLGQQGVGSQPFGIILQMDTTLSGDLVVLSQFPTKKVVYWFNAEGALLWRINLDEASLPLPQEAAEKTLLPSLQNVYPSPNEKKVYLNIVYYETILDANTGGELGIRVHSQKVFGFNLDSKVYDEEIPLPLYPDPENGMNYLLQMMGVFENTLVFGLSNNSLVNLTYVLVNRSSFRATEQNLQFPLGENLDLNLSPEGILTGMFLERNRIGVYWWPLGDLGFGV